MHSFGKKMRGEVRHSCVCVYLHLRIYICVGDCLFSFSFHLRRMRRAPS